MVVVVGETVIELPVIFPGDHEYNLPHHLQKVQFSPKLLFYLRQINSSTVTLVLLDDVQPKLDVPITRHLC